MYNSRRNKKNKPSGFSEANVPRPASLVLSNHLIDENQSKVPVGSAKKKL